VTKLAIGQPVPTPTGRNSQRTGENLVKARLGRASGAVLDIMP
jgi:hypothetical protein